MDLITLATFIGISLLILTLKYLIESLISPLRSIPGPLGARFSKAWYLLRVWNGCFEWDNIALHETHGSVVRYGPNEYSISDPEALKTIYGHGTEFNKTRWYEAWDAPDTFTLFTLQDNKIHGQMRRKFQSTYSMSSLITYETYADECVQIFCQRLDEMASEKREVNIGWWFQCYAADTIGMITYSKRFGFLDKGEDYKGLGQAMHDNLLYSSLVGIYYSIHRFLWNVTAYQAMLGLGKPTGRMALTGFTSGTLAERRKQRNNEKEDDLIEAEEGQEVDETAPKDFLSKFLDAHDKDPNKFTEVDIKVGLTSNVVAGSDTTASSLSGILYHLLRNPSTIKKLRSEIDDFVSRGEVSIPPTFKQTQAMPYLQAVVQEALRVHPATGLPLVRIVPPGGADICGYHFPEGTSVGVNPWVMHYSKEIFGADATEFRPERWIEADKERLSFMNRFWMPFGLGSRTCIGRNISMLEMSKLLPEIIRKYDFDLSDELKGSGTQWETKNHWFVVPENFFITVTPRQ